MGALGEPSPMVNRSRGFTLIELAIVLSIFALVAGMSIGVYRTVIGQNALPVAASQVSSIIRAAHNYSVSSGLPSRIYIDSDDGRISAFGYELVAAWSFEDLDEWEEGERLPRGTEIVGADGERPEVQGIGEVGGAHPDLALILVL